METVQFVWFMALMALISVSATATSQGVQVHPVYRISESLYPVTDACKRTCSLLAVVSGFFTSCIMYHLACRYYWQRV